MVLNRFDGAILNASPQKYSCDGADYFVLLDEIKGGDVLAELGDAGNEAVVGGLVE